MHLIVLPLAFIDSTISPFIDSAAVDIVIQKIPLVVASVCEAQRAFTMLQTIYVVSFEFRSIRSCLFALPMLSVVLPKPLVPGK